MLDTWTMRDDGLAAMDGQEDVTVAYNPDGQGTPFFARVGQHQFYARTLGEAQGWASTMVADRAAFLPKAAS